MLGTLAELAKRLDARVVGDGAVQIHAIASIDDAPPNALTFATSEKYLEAALRSRAGAVLVDEALVHTEDARKPLLVVPSARVALAQLLASFERPRKRGPFRHPTAVIAPDARVAHDAYVGALVYVGARSVIGSGAVLLAAAYVGDDASVGADSLLHPHAKVMDGCVIGKRTVLHPNAVIGGDGFGFVFIEGHFEKIPQVGNVVLGDDVEIGVNTCVDRAQTGSTTIGDGTKIDNLVQVGHNCRIGRHTAIAALTGLAGSTTVGDYVLIGGQAGFKGHITIGSRARIAGATTVWSDLPDDAFVSGRPARPHGEELRRQVLIQNLPKLVARVAALEASLVDRDAAKDE